MALTPEDILAKRFQITKFREGYDQDEVDDYLDEVVVELRKIIAENDELKARAASGADGEASDLPPFPTAVDPTPPASQEDTEASRSIIELAQKLHADHVHEGKVKREQMIRDAQREAARMIRDAEAQAREILNQMELDRRSVESSIEDLKRFEAEYRSKLRDYIQGQLEMILSEEAFGDLAGELAPAAEADVDVDYYYQEPITLGSVAKAELEDDEVEEDDEAEAAEAEDTVSRDRDES